MITEQGRNSAQSFEFWPGLESPITPFRERNR